LDASESAQAAQLNKQNKSSFGRQPKLLFDLPSAGNPIKSPTANRFLYAGEARAE
jgi:hypothetical protein